MKRSSVPLQQISLKCQNFLQTVFVQSLADRLFNKQLAFKWTKLHPILDIDVLSQTNSNILELPDFIFLSVIFKLKIRRSHTSASYLDCYLFIYCQRKATQSLNLPHIKIVISVLSIMESILLGFLTTGMSLIFPQFSFHFKVIMLVQHLHTEFVSQLVHYARE